MNSNNEKIPLYNPLATTFTATRYDDNNHPYDLIMESNEITFFSKHEAEFMKKRLLDELYNLEGDPKIRRDLEYTRLLSRIEVKL